MNICKIAYIVVTYFLIGLGFYLIPPFFGKRLRFQGYSNSPKTPMTDTIVCWPIWVMIGVPWILYKIIRKLYFGLKSLELRIYEKYAK
jgi:hypothetical protein